MKKTQLYSIITFCFCAGFIDFLTAADTEIIYPRDRIIHLFISVVLALMAIEIMQRINCKSTFVKILSIVFVLYRSVSIMIEFIRYYQTFHGSNTAGIILFSLLTIILYFTLIKDKVHLLYTFLTGINIVVFAVILLLSFDKINVVNIYGNSLSLYFSTGKLFPFIDVVTAFIIVEDKIQCRFIQTRYLFVSAAAFVLITLLQGLVVKGNILYSLSPLQSLMQVFTGQTIKRYDYMLTISQTINYYAAVMLYSWAANAVISKAKGDRIEK